MVKFSNVKQQPESERSSGRLCAVQTARARLCWLEVEKAVFFLSLSKILLPSGKDESCQKS